MKQAPGLAYWLRVVGLPLLLVLLTAAGLGSHYETNDDFSISLLLRGRTAAAPVTDLHLYFHGWAGLLAGLYRLWPEVPWYGLTLYALLTLALVLLTAVLEKLLTPHTRPGPRAGLLAAFLLLAGLEHAQWFNYVRVPLLLSGAAVLWAAQHYATRRWTLPLSLLLFAAAWAIRPSAAVLGLVAVAPAAWGLGGRPAGRVVAGATALAVVLGLAVQLTRSPEAARYRRLDVLKSEVLDYGWRVPAPRTRADSLGVHAVSEWAFGDSTLVNEAFFARAYQPTPHLLAARLRGLGPAAAQLGRDYFPLLGLGLLLGLLARGQPTRARRCTWLYPLGMLMLLLGLQLGLKLPPRLAGPLLTLFPVAYAALLPPLVRWPAGWRRRAAQGFLGVLLVLYAAKVLHRHVVLRREQLHNWAILERLGGNDLSNNRLYLPPSKGDGPLAGLGLEAAFKSLSPFRQYLPATGAPWLLLTGWTTLDPSQARLRRQLAGHRAQAAALRQLRRQPQVRWADAYPFTAPRPTAAERRQHQRLWQQLSLLPAPTRE